MADCLLCGIPMTGEESNVDTLEFSHTFTPSDEDFTFTLDSSVYSFAKITLPAINIPVVVTKFGTSYFKEYYISAQFGSESAFQWSSNSLYLNFSTSKYEVGDVVELNCPEHVWSGALSANFQVRIWLDHKQNYTTYEAKIADSIMITVQCEVRK